MHMALSRAGAISMCTYGRRANPTSSWLAEGFRAERYYPATS